MLANFANNLVGAFVALIIYQSSNNLIYPMIYLISHYILRLVFNLAFKKFYEKYPQLCLLLRIIPITLYNLCIFLMDHNLILGVIGVCIFISLDNSFNSIPKELIFNYSSLNNKSDKSIGVTRLFEQIGTVVSLIVGGFLLDFNKTLVLILSLSIYSISVIPLIIFYIKCRKQKTFNKDATSNAITTLKKKEKYKILSKKITKKMLITYGIIYFSFAMTDLLQTTFGLYIFIQKGEFAVAGILNAVFNCFYAVGFYVASIVNEKTDTTKLVSVIAVLIGIGIILLPFIDIDKYFIIICLIYGMVGFTYPFISLFVLDRMLIKTRIMGCSNDALFARETGCLIAYICGYTLGLAGLLAIFIATLVTMISSSIIIPVGEEKTRKNLVDFLQKNERLTNQIQETEKTQ
jgi:hypothetical protein